MKIRTVKIFELTDLDKFSPIKRENDWLSRYQ